MPASLKTTLEFLEALRFNNHKAWFDENRKRYEQARAHFEDLVGDLIAHFGPVEDLGSTTVKDCLYRINRDIRFSKDKSPYNSHMAALLGRGGRKATGRAYYVHVEPGGSMIAGGIYMPSSEELQRIRRALASDVGSFNRILADKTFTRYFGQMQGDKLKTAPKGFASDHPAIELLKHKQFMATHAISDDRLLADDLSAHIVAVCQALKPFVGYFHDILHESDT